MNFTMATTAYFLMAIKKSVSLCCVYFNVNMLFPLNLICPSTFHPFFYAMATSLYWSFMLLYVHMCMWICWIHCALNFDIQNAVCSHILFKKEPKEHFK